MRSIALLGLAAALLVSGCAPASTPAAAASGPASARGATPTAFPLIGSWVTTITPGDLEAAGITDQGVLHENAGRFTWTFDADGTWREVEVSLGDVPLVTPVFSGTFTNDASGLLVTTTFPEAYRDAGLRYTWQANADGTVSFGLPEPPDDVLRAITEAHPWQPASR